MFKRFWQMGSTRAGLAQLVGLAGVCAAGQMPWEAAAIPAAIALGSIIYPEGRKAKKPDWVEPDN